MSGHNRLGQTVQENNVGNWKSAGKFVRCQDVINARGGNHSGRYLAPCCKKCWGSSCNCSWTEFLSKTSCQGKDLLWGLVLTRRNKHSHSVFPVFSAPELSVEGSQVTVHLAFTREMSLPVLVWTDTHRMAGAVTLRQQEKQTSSGHTVLPEQ